MCGGIMEYRGEEDIPKPRTAEQIYELAKKKNGYRMKPNIHRNRMDLGLYVGDGMMQERKRTKVTCGNPLCGKAFSIQDSELKRRLKAASNGHVFCTSKCFQTYMRNNGGWPGHKR